ncbi:uncharacterized protein N7473_013058 [Penicillium subrubescens]|uniref:uncharacterized protein n=1 Tax=Penicillium subrubescens TaxID=1316194 RepID=UPI0025457622|nr:uncharacterized protein N7473_013058 [Penicillium subrubescens]KAJ5875711.1 hypothetical protein N7473_013058 [Penicillium subrubescens]
MWEFLKSPSRRRREARQRADEEFHKEQARLKALREQSPQQQAAATLKITPATPTTPAYKPYYPPSSTTSASRSRGSGYSSGGGSYGGRVGFLWRFGVFFGG